MADRIKNVDALNTEDELLQKIKSKNITLTRANRALIHILLNIKRKAFNEYIMIILFTMPDFYYEKRSLPQSAGLRNTEGFLLLRLVVSINCWIPEECKCQLNIFATHLYNQVIYDKY